MDKSVNTILIVICLLVVSAIGLWGLGSALVPLLASFAISYLLFPLVKRLESKGIKRSYALPALFSTLLIIAGLILALVLPSLISDTQAFLKELPASSSKAMQKIETITSNFGYEVDLSKDSVSSYIKSHISEISGGLLKGVTEGLKSSFSGLAKWLIAILNLFLFPLFFFYVISDYEKISEEFKSFIPKSIQPKLSHYFDLSNQVMSGYIRGQLMVALALGALYALGLSMVGLRFGILIGLFSGLISIIPYAGFSVGFLTAIIIALANYSGLGLLVGISAVFIIVQALEGVLITPKLVGNKVGLSSLATMLALIIGGNLLGLIGMLIAIPVAAICKTLINDLKSESPYA
ncbi:MAG: AI-2E family transporter [Bdellovibrionales bacterium]|jgi:predicted PurR-regulated permease PerM|nr:AI-2E family transporter [Bdellovibrionales bacterium]MBT3526988.1 AI-2E family transporter [Bdellovibrionales bacterium]